MSAIPTPDAGPKEFRLGRLDGPGPHVVSANGHDLVVVRTSSGLRAFQGLCPHRGALLGEGELDGDTLVCRNHRWQFRTSDGQRVGGPECLESYEIIEADGEIFVLLPGGDRDHVIETPRRKIVDLPGPKGLPLLGNAFQLDVPRLHEILEGWAEQYGPVYRYRLGSKDHVAVADPELASFVLRKRPEMFRRLSTIEPVFDEMRLAGVFSAEGTAWRPQRRLSMEALSHRHLKDFYPTLVRVAETLRARLVHAAQDGSPVDICDVLKRFTVDVTTLLTLGHDVNTLEQGDDVIQRKLEQIFPAFNRRLFALLPTWRLVRLPADRRLDHAIDELHDWMLELVAETRKRLEDEPERAAHPANFLEAMVTARDENDRPFSEKQILGNLVTMLVAGEDTTAYTLAWAVHHLSDAPEAVAALRDEADAALGEHLVPPTFEVASSLAYAGAVANETMRLRPVAPLLIFDANVDTVLGDIEIPAGTGVTVLARPPVLDPDNFADPLCFRPERWMPGAPAPHEPSVHIPFGSGPRLCPGRTLALLEMKLVLATVYRSFDITRTAPPEAVRERFTFTMNPVGLEIQVRERR